MTNSKILVIVVPAKSRVPREESSVFNYFWTPTFVGVTDEDFFKSLRGYKPLPQRT